MVNDFFLQTAIDFLLGNVTYKIFDEFEATMMTKDPAVSMQKMREQAIELCQRRVVADESEEFIGGWTMLSPHVSDSLTTQPFEEVVLMLTDKALYLCRFDWNLDKVSSFERVELAHIKKIRFGTYIISTNSQAQMDENKNVGLLVSYGPGTNDDVRFNTRSLTSLTAKARAKAPTSGIAGFLGRRNNEPATEKKMAFKALSSQSARAGVGTDTAKLSEIQQVVTICAEIERLALQTKPDPKGTDPPSTLIEKGDIISLADAKKNTGLLEQLGYSIKKMVWA